MCNISLCSVLDKHFAVLTVPRKQPPRLHLELLLLEFLAVVASLSNSPLKGLNAISELKTVYSRTWFIEVKNSGLWKSCRLHTYINFMNVSFILTHIVLIEDTTKLKCL